MHLYTSTAYNLSVKRASDSDSHSEDSGPESCSINFNLRGYWQTESLKNSQSLYLFFLATLVWLHLNNITSYRKLTHVKR